MLQYAFGSIVAILAVTSVIAAVLTRAHPSKNYVALKLRIQTWWWLAAVLFLIISFDRKVAVIAMAIVSFMAFKEFLSIAPVRRADNAVLLLAYLSIPVQYVWVGMAWYGMFIIFIPVYIFLLLPMRMAISGATQGFLRAAGSIQWGLMTTVFSISHMAFLLNMPIKTGEHGAINGEMLVFFLVVLTQMNDVAQYAWGKVLGRHRTIPAIHSSKTIEGLLGAIATTSLFAWMLAPWLTPMSPLHAVVAGVLISLFGFIGDVVISSVKLDIGLKDTGNLVPGHGGILDRLDSLTYTAPLFFHYIYYLYY